MGLKPGYSTKTQSANIRAAIAAGVSQNQAVAMALTNARRSAVKRGVPEKGPEEFTGKSRPAGTPIRRAKGDDMAKKKGKKGSKSGKGSKKK